MKSVHALLAALAGSLVVALPVTLAGCSLPANEAGRAAPVEGMAIPPADGLAQADELWILGRAARGEDAGREGFFLGDDDGDAVAVGVPAQEVPGAGGLVATDPASGRTVPVPLEHTSVRAEVRGTIATVDVAQRFTNPYDTKIEAVYVFPLPDDSAVHDFTMTIGERTIRGIVREREEAERLYAAARAQGLVASLLTEERPNVFTQRVANIEPGRSIEIALRYFDLLPLVDGWHELAFPLVVGPRFNPPRTSDGVGAVARGDGGTSGQSTEVEYLAPGERSGHDVDLVVDLDAGAPIREWSCTTHRVDARTDDGGRLTVALAEDDRIPDRDFVLRYRIAAEELQPALVTGRDERGAYVAVTLHPPAELERLEREPVELVFVLDTSGSMEGRPLELAKDAMRRALALLDARDSFQVLRFSQRASAFAPRALPATPENLRRGREYVESLDADGGTMMIEGVRAALGAPRDPERRRIVAFLTDGYVGNENEILAEERRLLGDARVFGFGLGSSVNRWLLEQMSSEGRGVSAFVGLSDAAGDVMAAFLERIRRPALEDIRLEGDALAGAELYPERVPDLFHGRPVTLVARLATPADALDAGLVLTGRAGGESVRIPLAPGRAESTALPWIFGRARIAALSSRALDASDAARAELAGEIRSTALEYGLSSAFTAFLAVDSSRVTEGDHGVTVNVPVPVPSGVAYETTVGGGD